MAKIVSKGGRRARNTDTGGRPFSKSVVDAVWNKTNKDSRRNSAEYRRDACGNLIRRNAYGAESIMGWEIDHKKPVANGGKDDLSNLQALTSSLNASKGDTYPWKCPGQ